MKNLQLHILSPEGTLVQAAVSLVTLPGAQAPFTVLPGHAALLSSLEKGEVRYIESGAEKRLPVSGGFARVENNTVTVCVEP